ncbi:NAD(P)-dependent oxidoreductase [Hoeflea sp. WL0058]|uniref:NAD(P)-dependent oxidoreductase n=1 Tax=Flavimaribacter sediminis TaxID=2865987 RepID=A0AAE2ZLK2_9HYPH|nr:NAD(P)-dependent oxidoreductase [Flavimaribacter sediminis]MBW8639094.1 NAD(P)-dependent oxidoreductase [Flavimaribacter sediminis]
MRVLVTGGSGLVGRFIVRRLAADDHDVTIAGRREPDQALFPGAVDFHLSDLDPDADYTSVVEGFDCLVHAAFSHVPGRYRGGEGDDVAGFRKRNLDATVKLFKTAAESGVKRGVFLSTRAVYGNHPAGTKLLETTSCNPDTEYGAVKRACEIRLQTLSQNSPLSVASLRITGVYGQSPPDTTHKWEDLFADYLAGEPVGARCGTEVHGVDVASAVALLLEQPVETVSGEIFNVSDILVDRHDLLDMVRLQTGCSHALPGRSDSLPNSMDTEKLRGLGWRPGGLPLLKKSVTGMLTR